MNLRKKAFLAFGVLYFRFSTLLCSPSLIVNCVCLETEQCKLTFSFRLFLLCMFVSLEFFAFFSFFFYPKFFSAHFLFSLSLGVFHFLYKETCSRGGRQSNSKSMFLGILSPSFFYFLSASLYDASSMQTWIREKHNSLSIFYLCLLFWPAVSFIVGIVVLCNCPQGPSHWPRLCFFAFFLSLSLSSCFFDCLFALCSRVVFSFFHYFSFCSILTRIRLIVLFSLPSLLTPTSKM